MAGDRQPANPETVAEFVADLRALRREAGDPSLRDLARLSKHTSPYSRTAFGDLFSTTRRPRVTMVVACVAACKAHALKAGLACSPERYDSATWQARCLRLQEPADASTAEGTLSPAPLPARPAAAAVPRAVGEVSLWLSRTTYLFVAVGSFSGRLPNLPETPREAELIADGLRHAAPWTAVQVALDVRGVGAREAVERAARSAGLLVVHLSTYGYLDELGRLRLLMSDSEEPEDGLDALDLARLLLRRADPTVLIVDSSLAGQVLQSGLFNDEGDEGRPPVAVIAAAGPEEQAYAGEHGLTWHLAALLATGDPALGDLLTVRDVFRYLLEASHRGSLGSSPLLATDNGGAELVLTANRARVTLR